MKSTPIDLDFIKECFCFDFESGVITWLTTRPQTHFKTWRGWVNWHNKNPGKIAGHIDANNYKALKLTLEGKEYNLKQHRLIYAVFHNDPNPPLIDNYDGNTINNSISNLKPSDKEFNAKNRYMSKLNKSGITGVKRRKDRPNLWIASIKVGGVTLTRTSADFFEVCCFRKSMELKAGYSERHGKEFKSNHDLGSPIASLDTGVNV